MATITKQNDDGFNEEDLKILTHIYMNILTNRQCKQLFTMIETAKNTFMEGTMPFGEHLYYCNEPFLNREMFDELKNIDNRGILMYHTLVIKLSKYILRKEGVI